jgi:hypothetical protein
MHICQGRPCADSLAIYVKLESGICADIHYEAGWCGIESESFAKEENIEVSRGAVCGSDPLCFPGCRCIGRRSFAKDWSGKKSRKREGEKKSTGQVHDGVELLCLAFVRLIRSTGYYFRIESYSLRSSMGSRRKTGPIESWARLLC